VLIALLPFLTIAIIPNQQIFNAYLVWAQDHADLIFFGKKMPTTWLITLDAIVSSELSFHRRRVLAAVVEKFPEPTEINKIAIGSLIAVTACFRSLIGSAVAAVPEDKCRLAG